MLYSLYQYLLVYKQSSLLVNSSHCWSPQVVYISLIWSLPVSNGLCWSIAVSAGRLQYLEVSIRFTGSRSKCKSLAVYAGQYQSLLVACSLQ